MFHVPLNSSTRQGFGLILTLALGESHSACCSCCCATANQQQQQHNAEEEDNRWQAKCLLEIESNQTFSVWLLLLPQLLRRASCCPVLALVAVVAVSAVLVVVQHLGVRNKWIIALSHVFSLTLSYSTVVQQSHKTKINSIISIEQNDYHSNAHNDDVNRCKVCRQL